MLLVVVLIGLNMRPLLTSVGPLLPQLRQASGMSFSVAALLTALPVVTMGGLALAGSWLHQHVSERRSVAISLLLIAVGALMRELYPQSALLLSSALLGGVGIGIIQAVMPSVIKRRFQQRTPLVMGLWSAALMGGGGWFMRNLAMALLARLTSNSTLRKWRTRKVANVRSSP